MSLLNRLDLNRIATFVRVVDLGSFTAAAQEMGLPTSSVSRAVTLLETELGVRLLQRTTRRLQPTDAGADFYARSRAAVQALAEAATVALDQGETPRGTVRMTAPPAGGSPMLARLIAEFIELYPEIRVELLLTPRVVDLVAEGVDLALRAGRLQDSNLMTRKLASIDAWVVAAPNYIERHGLPLFPDELADHPCVLYQARGGRSTWRLSSAEGERPIEVHGSVDADDLAFVHAAVVAGAGIGLLPLWLTSPDLSRGTLVRLLPDYAERGATMHLLWPSSSHLPARVALLRDFLAAHLVARCLDAPVELR